VTPVVVPDIRYHPGSSGLSMHSATETNSSPSSRYVEAPKSSSPAENVLTSFWSVSSTS
jgi:hypothetical protein